MRASVAAALLIQLINIGFSQAQFDHAFRKFSNYNYQNSDDSDSLLKDIPRQSDVVKKVKKDKKVVKKVGLAHGEIDEEEVKPVHHHQLLRRVGSLEKEDHDDQDQMAVETTKEKKSTQGLRQFSSGKLGNKFSKIQHKSINVLDFPKEHRLRLPEIPEFQVPKIDIPNAGFPKFNNLFPQQNLPKNAYAMVGEKARNFLVIATNTAFQGTTIATYLTQMWTANIIQTIGWALIGAFYSNANRRSFAGGRASSDSEAEVDEDELDSLMSKIDGKTVASLLRGIAEAAEMWHDEL